MKLSKKNAARQRVLQKAIASGKTLGGLLIGLAAATAAGGCRERSPATTMGSYPNTHCQDNAANEKIDEFAIEGEIPEPEDIPAPRQESSNTNAVREAPGNDHILRGAIMPLPDKPPAQSPQPNAVNEDRGKTRSAISAVARCKKI
jgi:hypothetical protein